MLNAFMGDMQLHESLIPSEDVDDFVILRVRAFTTEVRRSLVNQVLAHEELSVLEWQLLFSIARFGSCHMAFLTRHTSIDPAHGSRNAALLEKKGLVSRVEDPANKRRKLLSLTPMGIATFERIWPKARSVTSSITSRLNRSELDELKRLFEILNSQPNSETGAQNPVNFDYP